ncbi:MAG: hypothetical protein KKE44_14150 [Proteobacteria bacterium]|nr:hypothetical protein [Pseudomonadota bacterium]MBU1583868.1 hypothetical protein [Pseudomonadota bacterium]MBU2629583.1 hypothetical protein [Pseudomonadota bacterium]
MKKTIIVKTDDPEKKKFDLVVTGPVEGVVKITPESVYLDGSPGENLKAVVTITPSEKYMFSILGMEQKINTQIQARLIEPTGDKKSWQIEIKSHSDKPDDLFDVLTLKTDSPYKPTLTIRVYAIFIEKPQPKS